MDKIKVFYLKAVEWKHSRSRESLLSGQAKVVFQRESLRLKWPHVLGVGDPRLPPGGWLILPGLWHQGVSTHWLWHKWFAKVLLNLLLFQVMADLSKWPLYVLLWLFQSEATRARQFRPQVSSLRVSSSRSGLHWASVSLPAWLRFFLSSAEHIGQDLLPCCWKANDGQRGTLGDQEKDGSCKGEFNKWVHDGLGAKCERG